jgi:acetoin utilization deacetylase AcuC-like enzyme
LTPDSIRDARRAACALCLLTERVIRRRCDPDDPSGLDHGFAVIRPPGHHAEAGLAGGYCLVNNVAVAAAYALQYRLDPDNGQPNPVRRVCIVDWDVHHGNGTQSIFYADPRVLYFSVHLYLAGVFYPHTGRHEAVGEGPGAGRTVNVAWSCHGMGDSEYLAVWEMLLLPMLSEFNPDLLLISAGFDAATGDIGNCRVTPIGFAILTSRIKETLRNVAAMRKGQSAPVVCTLEGGYTRTTLSQCVASVVEALLNRDVQTISSGKESFIVPHANETMHTIHPSAARNIRQTMQVQRPHWKFLLDDDPPVA